MVTQDAITDLGEPSDMFSISNAPPYDEIAIMKELVLEFGEAINERIREDNGPLIEVNSPSDTHGANELDSLCGAQLKRQATKNSYM